jgi:mRNA interferase YafQ
VAKSKPPSSQQEPPPPLDAKPTSTFKQETKLCKKRGKDLAKLRKVIEDICNHRPLDEKYVDHSLVGKWKGCRGCHIEPDWVLIYQKGSKILMLHRTGTHSDLFGKSVGRRS